MPLTVQQAGWRDRIANWPPILQNSIPLSNAWQQHLATTRTSCSSRRSARIGAKRRQCGRRGLVHTHDRASVDPHDRTTTEITLYTETDYFLLDVINTLCQAGDELESAELYNVDVHTSQNALILT